MGYLYQIFTKGKYSESHMFIIQVNTMEFESLDRLIALANASGTTISEIVISAEAEAAGVSKEFIFDRMRRNYLTMQQSVSEGLQKDVKSASKLSGGDAYKLKEAYQEKKILQDVFTNAMIKALAVSELNACMGKIVASPTAGSCGILPAALISAAECYHFSETDVIRALFTAGGIGMVIAKKATLSGAEGGCQAECGSAAAMAAGALTELLGGTPAMVAHACALSLKSYLGLICDPVAGLVEVPCVKRNAMGAVNALSAATMATAGIESKIPADEVIEVMGTVGRCLPKELRETSLGGIAQTPTAKDISKRLAGTNNASAH
jgi:L-serine dehydratase